MTHRYEPTTDPRGARPRGTDQAIRLRLRSSGADETVGTVLKWLVVLSGTVLLSLAGCSRTFYRQRADRDVYGLVDATAARLPDACGNYSIQLHPASRMFDPFNPDCSPMPPDDPAAHSYLQAVAGMRGSHHWFDHGQALSVENPCWWEFLPVSDEGKLVLDPGRSVRLGLLHSREYQRELEDLYFSALDVSLQRFEFDTQFFGGYTVDYAADGPDRRLGSTSPFLISTLPTAARGIRMNKLFATGAELVVGLANSFLWQFTGTDQYSATTLVDFTLVQPLLRDAGRGVVLEELTQSQRDLLYNVRQFERFRRGFYLTLVAGRGAGLGPGRNLRVLGSSGVFATSGAGAVGGYLGLLRDRQTIRNLQANIASLRSSLLQFEAFFQANRIDFFQRESVRQTLLTRQSQLLRDLTDYQAALDRYKIALGLPPQLEVQIDDSMLGPLNLFDTETVELRNELTDLQEEIALTLIGLLPPVDAADGAAAAGDPGPAGTQWSDDLAAGLVNLQQTLPRLEDLRQRVLSENVPRAREDMKRLNEALPKRQKELKQLQKRLAAQLAREAESHEAGRGATGGSRAPFEADLKRLQEAPGRWKRELEDLTRQFQQHESALEDVSEALNQLIRTGPTLTPDELLRRQSEVFGGLRDEVMGLSGHLLELTVLQARARTESVMLEPIEVDADVALEIARVNRRDWMNARGNLVDSWRDIKVAANALESDLDIVFEGDISNKGDNPLQLRGTTGRLRAAAQFDAPLTRLSERNTYRETQILYQQARRDYMEFEDRVAEVLRDIVRNIELSQMNFELRRAAVHVAIARVEFLQLQLQEMTTPPTDTSRRVQDALASLLNVQNDFMGVWITYEALRRSLDFDMGTMQLDAEGIWADPGAINLRAAGGEREEELESVLPGPFVLPPANDSGATQDASRVRLASFFDGRRCDESRSADQEEATDGAKSGDAR